jgi:hypothetical protein
MQRWAERPSPPLGGRTLGAQGRSAVRSGPVTPNSTLTTCTPRIVRRVRHDVVVSAAGCRIGEHVRQRPVKASRGPVTRDRLRLPKRHADLDITLSDAEGRGERSPSRRSGTSWRAAKMVAQGARERMFCHVTPIRTPCSRSLACRPAVRCQISRPATMGLNWAGLIERQMICDWARYLALGHFIWPLREHPQRRCLSRAAIVGTWSR